MNAIEQNTTDPFILLSDLARQPGVTRTALELAIRARKLTVISRHGKYWVHRLDARDWLSWRASVAEPSGPLHEFEL
jgi:hypothetical protein